MLDKTNTIVNKMSAELDNKVLRSKLIASNIANIDTPGFKSKDVKFENVLTEQIGHLEMKTSHPRHMTNVTGGILRNEVLENPNPGRPDGNNVDIDDEMLKLSENNVQYNVVVQLLSTHLGKIKAAVAEAGR